MKIDMINYCLEYEKGILCGDNKTANKAHDKISNLLSALSDTEKLSLLPQLCDHDCEAVQLWAARYLLDVDENMGLSTIERIIGNETLIGLVAEVVLDQWKSNAIKLQRE
ncbi:MAG: hypothetical protein QNJ01_06615 [Desulfobacterales bacterium]|nr:hypothetical protein [Desulfobacterales bacterium]